ncbi:MAG: hypothetical protein PHO01_10580 [Desulfotomaculaceae bacterium]|nr:hypothetical protein [Desulfotomaculaceae bacterium]
MNIDLSKKNDLAYGKSELYSFVAYLSDCIALGKQSLMNGTYNISERRTLLSGRTRGSYPKPLKSLRYGRADPHQLNSEKGADKW